MFREKNFEQIKPGEAETEELPPPEKADWEIIRDRHLAAKEAFHKARAEAKRTGKEKYLDNKFRK